MTDISNTSTSPSSGSSTFSDGDNAALALKSSVVGGAQDVTEGVKHLAQDVMGETRKSAESQVSAGKLRAADGLKSVASALRKTGEQLRQEDQDAFTQYFDQAAQRVDAVSGYIRKRTLPELMTDVEGFARRDPALFIGGALVLGLLGGRFLKSSRPTTSSPANSGRGQGTQQGNAQGTNAQGANARGAYAAPRGSSASGASRAGEQGGWSTGSYGGSGQSEE